MEECVNSREGATHRIAVDAVVRASSSAITCFRTQPAALTEYGTDRSAEVSRNVQR